MTCVLCDDHYESGALAAEERIIKLIERIPLEAVYSAVMNCLDEAGIFDHESAVAEKKKLIDLIKGEQK